jgi:hypothetical protein
MPVELRFAKHIALGQKSGDDPGPYGQGFNYRVEAGFLPCEEPEKHLDEVLKAIDHRHLGLDFHAIGEPTTANICRWIFDRLKERGCAVTDVILSRGDGLTASCRD